MTSTCCYYIAVRIAVVAWFCAWVVRVKRDLERVHGVVAVGVRFERGLYHTVYRLLSGLFSTFRLAWYRLFRLILSTGHENMRGFQQTFGENTCHPERSEGSGSTGAEILRCAQSLPLSAAKG